MHMVWHDNKLIKTILKTVLPPKRFFDPCFVIDI